MLDGIGLTPPEGAPHSLAGRTAHCLSNWSRITDSDWVLKAITDYKLELISTPSQTHHPVTVVQQDKADILQQEIMTLLDKGVIAKVPKSQAAEGFYSTLFLVLKNEGQYRPVINLKNLNYHLKTEHFKMEGMHIVRDLFQTQDWMTRLDLKDVYLAMPVHHKHRKFLRF